MKQLIVFDFDWSLVDQDSDRWIFEVLAPHLRRKMKTLKTSVQWTDLVAQSLKELHKEGKSKEEIIHALEILPFHPAMIRCLKALKSDSTRVNTLLCLSNSNSVFISTILKSKGLDSVFDEIITNPAEWEDDGLLNVRRRIDPSGAQHSCTVGCSPNMCKGEELLAFLRSLDSAPDRIIYVGDGSNDFCPILRLKRNDVVLCRSHRGLADRISKEGDSAQLQSRVIYWSGAWEVEEFLTSS